MNESITGGNKSPVEIAQMSKKERMAMIAKLIMEAPLASSEEEASALVVESFNKVEGQLPADFEAKMYTRPLEQLMSTKYKGQNIYFQLHVKHMILIGENGAIAWVRDSEQKIQIFEFMDDPGSIKGKFPAELSKPGADGKDVWGDNI